MFFYVPSATAGLPASLANRCGPIKACWAAVVNGPSLTPDTCRLRTKKRGQRTCAPRAKQLQGVSLSGSSNSNGLKRTTVTAPLCPTTWSPVPHCSRFRTQAQWEGGCRLLTAMMLEPFVFQLSRKENVSLTLPCCHSGSQSDLCNVPGCSLDV